MRSAKSKQKNLLADKLLYAIKELIKCTCKRTYTVHYHFRLVINLEAFMIT